MKYFHLPRVSRAAQLNKSCAEFTLVQPFQILQEEEVVVSFQIYE